MLRQAKESVLLTHSIEYDLSGQNKLMRDKELRKAEHLSNVNGPTVQIWSIQTKRTPWFEILQTRIGKQYAYTRIIRYAVDFSISGRRKGFTVSTT